VLFNSVIDEAYYSNDEVDSDEVDDGLDSDEEVQMNSMQECAMNQPKKSNSFFAGLTKLFTSKAK
jgi:hypothetical protein